MKRIFFILISFSIFFYSCSKKDVVKDNSTTENKQKTTNEKKVDNTITTKNAAYYTIKDIGSSGKKSDFVDFTWQEDGKDVKLSDNKGKVILLNFWATWCPPCRKELPSLSAISNELDSKEFKMIGISVDENPEALKSFLKSNTLSYTMLHENGVLLEKYMTIAGGTENVIPQSFIIDKNGKVVEYIIGSKEKQEFLKLINKHL